MSSRTQKNADSKQRFDYNRIESIKLRQEMQRKQKELIEKGRPDVRFWPFISWNVFISVLIGLTSIGFLWFGFYPEPPISPILFQWESMGHEFDYKDNKVFYIGMLRVVAVPLTFAFVTNHFVFSCSGR